MNQRGWFASLAALLILAGVALTHTALNKSPVFDEVVYAPAGLVYWKTGNFQLNPEHPPLQKLLSALPLLTQSVAIPATDNPFFNDAWRSGYQVFFFSPTPAPKLIFLARLPSILLTLLVGFTLFWWVRKRAGAAAGFFAAAVFLLDPLVLGNGSLALNDIFVTAFFFWALLLFESSHKNSTAAWAGLMLGLAVASKFTALLLPWLFVLLLGWRWQTLPDKSRALRHLAITLGTGFLVFLLIYRFDSGLIKQALALGAKMHDGEKGLGFLLGPLPAQYNFIYYPVALLIKTPLPLLLLWAIAIVVAVRSRAQISKSAPLLTPVAALILVAMISRNHYGVRYLLPALPLLAALAGLALKKLESTANKKALWLMLAWLTVESAVAHPHHMAYFNELIGGSKQGHRWLDGSNQDWGQDLPGLAAYWDKQGRPSLILGYMGAGSPEAYGLKFQDGFSAALMNSFREETVNPVVTDRELLAVSAHLLRPGVDLYGFLKDRTPITIIGHTLFVYDITQDAAAARVMATLYRAFGRPALALRQEERAAQISVEAHRQPGDI